MHELLALSAHLPEHRAAAGETLIAEGPSSGACFVLVEGAVEVRQRGVLIAATSEPGTCFGEIAALLGVAHTADVVAVQPSRLRVAADASALFAEPDVGLAVARLLAARLRLATAYLADLQRQYAGVDGNLGLVGDVLGTLMQHGNPAASEIRPASAREPHPPY